MCSLGGRVSPPKWNIVKGRWVLKPGKQGFVNKSRWKKEQPTCPHQPAFTDIASVEFLLTILLKKKIIPYLRNFSFKSQTPSSCLLQLSSKCIFLA